MVGGGVAYSLNNPVRFADSKVRCTAMKVAAMPGLSLFRKPECLAELRKWSRFLKIRWEWGKSGHGYAAVDHS